MMLPLLFMSNRQKKAQQKQLELVRQLGVGDEVRTHSGFFGLIVEAYDDVVVLESEDGSQSKWARQAIAQQAVAEDAAEEEGEQTEQEPSSEDEVPGVTVTETATADEAARRDRD
ncbi:preprotein translocase YidC [Brachybacterium ginsengisoli]|uniref:Preprotein translocase YidC n=2 Tax=Brachybacterium ginsengisoli TaxID=1331682 RepID=A0A291H2A8_9MICO|nr:preprotein translocase YidC [Brachybacterium ginsengisoli]